MNKSAFLELIQQASNISDQQTEELEKVAATFPYCQTAHLLLAKSAYDKGSMFSTQRLRRASAYATNRQVLKRIIYTSPAPAPVFDAPAVEEQEIVSPETAETLNEAAAVTHQQAFVNTIAADDVIPTETIFEEATAEEAGPEETAPAFEEVSATDPLYVEDAVAETEDEAVAASLDAAYTETLSESNTHGSDEAIPYELAELLTINSLNATFTDLLAQKPDPESQDTATVENEEQSHVTFPDHFKEADDELAQIIAAESPLLAQSVYVLEDSISSPAVETESPEAEDEDAPVHAAPEEQPAVAAPENAPINYALNEIDRMYAEDPLGYWMASSRMGEVLQLKDEVTRQRPASFHPELILEYTKTHELEEKPEEQQAPSLHHQINIIDQFLKLNPRLKTMNNIKMKQEPQEDLSLRNSKIKKGIASESLANIFLKQGKVKKAIKIYEQLILKYPEKKSYFAEQIEKLQNLE